MNQQDKTKEQLIGELRALQRQAAVLESRLAALNHSTGSPGWEQGPVETSAPGAEPRTRGLPKSAEATEYLKAESTERREPETDLGPSEDKYRRLIENINDVVFSLDVQGRFTYMSPVIKRLAQYDANEVIGQSFESFVHPDDLDDLREKFQQALSGRLAPHDFRILAKDGSLIHVRTSSRPLRERGRVVGLTGVMADITERKEAEEALWESENRLRTLMDLIPDPLVVYDPQGCVTYVNTAFVKTYGWSPDELVGKRIDFVPPGEEERTQEAWERTMRREPILFETRRFTKDRKLLDIEATTAVLLDQQGNHRASVVIHRDVTKRKRAEEAFRQANAELESFSYSVSHDLRAPLRGIDGWSLALLEDCADRLDEQGRRYLELVRTETQRMGELIDDLLHLSRVTRAEMRRVEVDLSALVGSIATRLRDAEPGRQVQFVIEPGLTVHGDPRLLEIMLSNLLDNAWKFTGRHASARIEFGRTETDGRAAYFVRDDGAGFDMNYARKLFGAFQRMHRTSEFPGTGVGLATVQRIVHRHDGRVWAEAEVEKGATFHFTLKED